MAEAGLRRRAELRRQVAARVGPIPEGVDPALWVADELVRLRAQAEIAAILSEPVAAREAQRGDAPATPAARERRRVDPIAGDHALAAEILGAFDAHEILPTGHLVLRDGSGKSVAWSANRLPAWALEHLREALPAIEERRREGGFGERVARAAKGIANG
jgi:hypothetical protein